MFTVLSTNDQFIPIIMNGRVLITFSFLIFFQLEDDVITKPGYFSTMKNFALNQKTDDWLLLEFSYLGFIGQQL